MITLGIDTSNYTTSCAVYDSSNDVVSQRKKLLPVKQGEKGLRQSDAVFHHTQQLFPLINDLFSGDGFVIDAVGVSDRPRDVEGSYMPCFTVGLGVASSVSSVVGVPKYCFSHQAGHIMASLYSSGSINLIDKEFLAFHVSGGTTELLHVSPDKERIFHTEIVGCTEDLNCGQAIDRAGVMLGLGFPCGKELEILASDCQNEYNPRVCVRDGNCSLSGLENQCQNMLKTDVPKIEIAKYCLDFIKVTIDKMTEYAVVKFGDIPVVYAGGVMSDLLIRKQLESKYNAKFAAPEYSCDNAAGTALLAYYRSLVDVG